jgi:hypothetical protein
MLALGFEVLTAVSMKTAIFNAGVFTLLFSDFQFLNANLLCPLASSTSL